MENPQTLHGRDGAVKAKARIVLLGFQHPNLLDPTFKTSSPVQSSLGRHLLHSIWKVWIWPQLFCKPNLQQQIKSYGRQGFKNFGMP